MVTLSAQMHLQVCEQLLMGSMGFLSHDIKVYIAQFSIFKQKSAQVQVGYTTQKLPHQWELTNTRLPFLQGLGALHSFPQESNVAVAVMFTRVISFPH